MKTLVAIIFLSISLFLTAQNTDKSMGDQYYDQGKFDSALVFYMEELNKPETYFDHTQKANILSNIGNVHEELGNYDQALDFYKQTLKVSEAASYQTGTASAYNLIGNIYYRWGSYDRALNYYNSAIEIAGNIEDNQLIPSILNNIGNVYYSWKEYEASLDYYLNALEIKEIHEDSVELTSYLINIGSCYLGMKEYDKSLNYYNQSLELARNNNNLQNIANCLINIGYLHHDQEMYEEAMKNYELALIVIDKTGSSLLKAFTMKNMGETYLVTDNLDLALNYLNQSKEIAEEENMREMLADIYRQVFEIYQKKEMFDMALKHHILYKDAMDSIFTQNSSEKLNQLRAEFETEKKENELKQKDAELIEQERIMQNQRIMFILGIAVLIALAGMIYLILKNREIKRRNYLESELDKQMQMVLSAQMNPHFISNALNSIQKFFLTNDFKQANEYLADFGGLIRTILENSRKLKITVEEEIQSIKLYLSLESNRLENKFSYEIHVEEDLNPAFMMVPSLIIQPYVENAIWHGIAPLEGKGHIDIFFRKDGDDLKCIIEDNGIGINESEKRKMDHVKFRKSLGIEINNKRIELLNKAIKTNMQVIIQDRSDLDQNTKGTIVTFKIPQE